MDRAIYGDNQFFGINHSSELKANERAARFQSDHAIYETLCIAHEVGVRTFMFTTHARLENVCNLMARDPRFQDFKLIPCIPYAYKYANAMTEHGVIGALHRYMPKNVFSTSYRLLRSGLTGDPAPTMKSLIDAELKPYRKFHIEAVFLLNIATDFAMGLGMNHLLGEFHSYLDKSYKVKPGFITLNHTRLESVLRDELGIQRPLICSPINSRGFRMNPTKSDVEASLRNRQSQVVAMSVLASGSIPPREALEYVNKLPGVDSIVFGASSRANIEQTFNMLNAPA